MAIFTMSLEKGEDESQWCFFTSAMRKRPVHYINTIIYQCYKTLIAFLEINY